MSVTADHFRLTPVTNAYRPVTPASPVPGGVDEVPWLRAYTVPSAAPAASAAPILIMSDRVWCCLAGAMATPAGLAAAPPAVGTLSAVAATTGSAGFLGCGDSGIVVVVCGAALGAGCCCCVSEASGYVVTGCSGACDGFNVVPWFVVPWFVVPGLAGCDWFCPAGGVA